MSSIDERLRKKIVKDYKTLEIVVNGLKASNYTLVVTIGSWDMLHIGHLRYLIKAKSHGDKLIVGVDSDRIIRKAKGEHRPVIPQEERMEMLSYQDFVDYVTLVDDVDKNGAWQYELIELLKPSIFIAEKTSYTIDVLKDIKRYCAKVVVLNRQTITTSSSAILQEAVQKNIKGLLVLLDKRGGK